MKQLGIEFKVGLFTLMGLAATGYLFFALTPDAFDNKKVTTFNTYLRYAAGIVPKTHVKTSGVSIGKVKEVTLGASNTKVTFEIDSTVKIPKGSTLSIKSVGFLGDSHLEIARAEDHGEYLEENEFVPESTDAVDLNGLIEIAGDVAKDIKKVTANLADALGTEHGKEKLHNIVDNIEAVTKSARGILEDNRADIRKFVANLSDVLDDENKDKIDRIIAAFDESMIDVKQATRNISLIAARVEKGEGTLGKLVNDDTALNELQGAIKDIREVLAPATKLEITVDSHIEARTNDESQTYFDLKFRTRPDRYYLLGFTDTDEEIVEERVEDITNEQNKDEKGTSTRTTSRTEKALKFNLQFAKRWYFMAVRFGLFESTGGFGADFYLFNDRFKFTMEAFDWKSKDNNIRRVAHLKAYASVLFFNHIYLMGGVDDPTKFEERMDPSRLRKPNYFIGAGLTFNDQDLKALFGAAALGSVL